jgi:hypothetical protein
MRRGESGLSPVAGTTRANPDRSSSSDAYAVLAPAVEGVPRASNFPELTEAQTLLAALGSDPSALRQRGRPESRKINAPVSW